MKVIVLNKWNPFKHENQVCLINKFKLTSNQKVEEVHLVNVRLVARNEEGLHNSLILLNLNKVYFLVTLIVRDEDKIPLSI
jgi:hypothetical protein